MTKKKPAIADEETVRPVFSMSAFEERMIRQAAAEFGLSASELIRTASMQYINKRRNRKKKGGKNV